MAEDKLRDEPARLAALHRYQVLDTDAEQPFDKITGLVQQVLDVPISAVSLIDQHRQWFKSRQGLDACETARDISFCTHTIRDRTPMVIPDARLDPRFVDNPLVIGPPHILSYAGVPLATPDGYNIGALCAIDRIPRMFTDQQIDILRNFGAIVVDELELRQIAQRDHLTAALTRRGLVAQLGKEIIRRDRHDRPSALILCDIDHFKAVNDRYGHPVGDAVLRAVAACWDGATRPTDAFGRVGGEEFALLLPETLPEDAMRAAERYRAAVEALEIDVGATVRVTASFGVAPLTADITTPEQWLARADLPLYAAKHDGRNQCRLAEPVAAFC